MYVCEMKSNITLEGQVEQKTNSEKDILNV